jgi:hypothetical protein
MRSRDLLEIQELRDRERLLVPERRLTLFDRFLGADGQSVAGDFEIDVLRIDARQRDINAPAVVGGVRVERGRLARRRTRREVAPELVEQPIELALEAEHLIHWIPTIQAKHRSFPPARAQYHLLAITDDMKSDLFQVKICELVMI